MHDWYACQLGEMIMHLRDYIPYNGLVWTGTCVSFGQLLHYHVSVCPSKLLGPIALLRALHLGDPNPDRGPDLAGLFLLSCT